MIEAARVAEHYGQENLTQRLRAALAAAGLGEKRLSVMDLAPLDQFHSRGLAATVELTQTLAIGPDTLVLDIGSGLGGPSRYLAATFGCRVHGIDLSPAFVDAARYLAERTGLADRVVYQCGDALSLPYDAGSFDLTWTQHVAMNIDNRAQLYSEAFRVLRPGGRFAIYDVVAGGAGPLHFPVPWAAEPATSHVVTSDAMRAALEQRGFRVRSWVDQTQTAIAWFAERRASQATTPGVPPLGLHIAMGSEFAAASANLARNLREGRAALIEAVLEKP